MSLLLVLLVSATFLVSVLTAGFTEDQTKGV